MEIRAARPDDTDGIRRIYAHHVLHGTGTFEEEPPDEAAIGARMRRGLDAGYAWLVAADETGLLGFGYYGPFRERAAYRHTVEDSIYVREDVRGQGVGKALVARLLEVATAAGFRQMLALIGDSDNVSSIGMHASLGFTRAGVLRATGLKFGRILDVVIMQRRLGRDDHGEPEPDGEPGEPAPEYAPGHASPVPDPGDASTGDDGGGAAT